MTFLELDEITTLMTAHAERPGERIPHRRLADDVTGRVHGVDAVRRATAAAAILFGNAELRDADADTLAMVSSEVATTPVGVAELTQGISIVDALVSTGLAASKADARRGLTAGGFSVNGAAIDGQHVLTSADLLPGGVILLRKGKRSWAAMRASQG
jgi:tyrosyl-tRNA synthetase